MITSALELQI